MPKEIHFNFNVENSRTREQKCLHIDIQILRITNDKKATKRRQC